MTVAQGLYKKLAYKKQSGLGVPASGSGGQLLRRETATFNKANASYSSDEIVSSQQYTGDTYGPGQTAGQINGLLSPKTYADPLGSLNRSAFAAGVVLTGLSLTIAAGSGTTFTITRGSGSWLTDGLKVGDVKRLSAGAFTGTAASINLLIVALTATIATVIVPNGKVLTAQGPVTGSTVTVIGKKTVTPSTGQLNDYYTFEEQFTDVARNRVYSDVQIASADIAIPATGNSTIKLACLGLARTKSGTASLTSPTVETTTAHLSAAQSVVFVNGAQTLVGTSLAIKIDGQLKAGDPVIGSNSLSDIIKGDIKVTGTVTVQYDGETVSNAFDNQTALQIVGVLFADTTDTSDFMGFSIPRAKLFKDDIDDGKKQLVMTCDFVAEINSAGGAGASTDIGIISIQDSAA